MTRRTALVALAFAGAAQLSTGCVCNRPLFPRLRCLVCGPTPVGVTSPAPGPDFAPSFASPAYGPPPAPIGGLPIAAGRAGKGRPAARGGG